MSKRARRRSMAAHASDSRAPNWTEICRAAQAGEPVVLDSVSIAVEQFNDLVGAATTDRAYKPGQLDRPTFAEGSSFANCCFESGASFHSLILVDIDLCGVSLQDADFYQAKAAAANLTAADFNGSILINCEFTRVAFTKSNLTNTKFYRANLTDVDFASADLTRASFREASLQGCDFSAATLNRTNFRDATLAECSFAGAIITNASFRDADLSGTSFERVRWDPAHPPLWPRHFTPPSNTLPGI